MSGAANAKAPRKRRGVKAYLVSPQAIRLLISILGCALVMGIFVLAIVPMRYDVRVGMVPGSTIAATKDVEDTITTEARRAQAAALVMPTYRYQEGITEKVLADFDQIFVQLRTVRQYGETLPNNNAIRVYTRDELQYARDMLTLITLRDYQISSLLQSTAQELETAYSLLYTAIQSIMQGHVSEGQEAAAITSIRQIVDYRISISLGQNIVPAVLKACIQPNMMIDQEATDVARQAARDAVEPTVYKQGQNIVVRGEGRITANQMAMLSSLGLLSDGEVDLPMYLGASMLVLLVLVGMLLLLRKPEYFLMSDTVRLELIFIVQAMTLGLCVLARLIDAYLSPALLSALLLTALLGRRSGLICGAAMVILVAGLVAGGSEEYTEKMVVLITTGLLSTTAVTIAMHNRSTRMRVLTAGLVGCATDFLVFLALGLMTNSYLGGTMLNALRRVLGSLLATLLCIGLQPLLEAMFNLPTPMKLLELSNPNQPLLRRLLLEAPGTYHHSTIVSNLAEAAAEAVGANPLLARVGGFYHDIGKLKRPLYFKENQLGDNNIHDHTDPHVSAAILTAHTKDGVALAKQYRLPQAVQNIIAEHHGDTPVMFFYHKALQQAGGKPVDVNAFRYDGRPPHTKEGAIVLLCDTIEAAVRTMKNPTPEGIEDFIVKLVRGKLEDGQLSDSPLTLQDIDKICAAATTVLSGVFHERIEYPDMDKNQPQPVEETKEEAKEEAKEETRVEAKEEASEEAKEEPSVVLPESFVEPLPVVEMENRDPMAVVAPEALPQMDRVEPLPTIGPVAIDELVQLEPITVKDVPAPSPEEPGAGETLPSNQEVQEEKE